MNKPPLDTAATTLKTIDKWNRIYRNKTQDQPNALAPQPCSLLAQYHYLLPPQGNALDLACGLGGNAIFLQEQGLNTCAWDISDIAIAQLNDRKLNQLEARVVDIEQQTLPDKSFDIIVVSGYLHRPLCSAIIDALRVGGLLFYQTFHLHKLSNSGPSNPDFLLQNNELLELFSELTPLIYQQLGSQGDLSQGERNLAGLIAEKTF